MCNSNWRDQLIVCTEADNFYCSTSLESNDRFIPSTAWRDQLIEDSEADNFSLTKYWEQ